MNPSDDTAVALTRAWIEGFVMKLGLCPFAAAPVNAGRVAYEVCSDERGEAIYQAFLQTLYELLTRHPDDVETALLIVPHGLDDFEAYLDQLELLQQALVEAGAVDMVQVASFHPDYRFDGVPADDPANYSNRSPFPMFHLLREDGMSAALEDFADPEAIPERNVARLRELGIDGIRALRTQAGLNDE